MDAGRTIPDDSRSKDDDFSEAYERELAALAQLEALKKQKAQLKALRATNTTAIAGIRTDFERSKNSLKSDLKRSTALVKKLKNLTEDAKQSILRYTLLDPVREERGIHALQFCTNVPYDLLGGSCHLPYTGIWISSICRCSWKRLQK